MTRRELINRLLDGDMNDKMGIVILMDDGDDDCDGSYYPITYVDGDVIGFEDEEYK